MKKKLLISFTLLVFVLSLVFILLLFLYQNRQIQNLVNTSQSVSNTINRNISLIAVGDLACNSESKLANISNTKACRSMEILDRISKESVDAILLLGDLQYDKGSKTEYEENFINEARNIKSQILASPGNHDYGTGNAETYLNLPTYLPNIKVKSDLDKTYYYKDFGKWRIISLDSNCEFIGGCMVGSEEYAWLKDLVSNSRDKYIIAFWHHPVWNVGKHRSSENITRAQDIQKLLQDNGAKIILNGHDHNFQYFKDNKTGLTEFVVGTGGHSLYKMEDNTNSYFVNGDFDSFGYLRLELKDNGNYKFEFVKI